MTVYVMPAELAAHAHSVRRESTRTRRGHKHVNNVRANPRQKRAALRRVSVYVTPDTLGLKIWIALPARPVNSRKRLVTWPVPTVALEHILRVERASVGSVQWEHTQ